MTFRAYSVIMMGMKKFSIILLMAMFLANTVVVSAWAKPCMMNDVQMSETSSDADMGEVPPCHEESKGETQDNLKHCDGVCLCLHVSVTQIPLLTDFVAVPDIVLGADVYNLSNEVAFSRDYPPTNPPPIFIS